MKLAVGAKRDQALIRSICSLARELGCSVIGEMIETEEEANMCQSLGIGFGQGYLFGKPERKIREASKPMIGARKKGYVATWL
jgi:EAL domain-containing protein (putative c-di-GMP-specific phosphodiesterase class I)